MDGTPVLDGAKRKMITELNVQNIRDLAIRSDIVNARFCRCIWIETSRIHPQEGKNKYTYQVGKTPTENGNLIVQWVCLLYFDSDERLDTEVTFMARGLFLNLLTHVDYLVSMRFCFIFQISLWLPLFRCERHTPYVPEVRILSHEPHTSGHHSIYHGTICLPVANRDRR